MTVKTSELPTLSWVDIHEWMNEHNKRDGFDDGHEIPATHKTTIRKTTDDSGEQAIVVRLHTTDVLTLGQDGTLVVDCGGWHTVTTRQRIDVMTTGMIRTLKMLVVKCRLEVTDYDGKLHNDEGGCIVIMPDAMSFYPGKPDSWSD